MNVQGQKNSYDSGVYAVGFITALLYDKDPTAIDFLEPRRHLVQCLRSNTIAPFPTSTNRRSPQILFSISVPI